jgi:NADPH-dependent 2,4-dienoyl-CoA reductase/sulfur reductase-like enzyme/peroxiredoxin family protein/rhodanese-related sulfurtransferase/TusA-related sulfurtransferase
LFYPDVRILLILRSFDMKIVIVGGVAAGAGAAARLRRLDENAEIILLERGPYISYANCGLPYHIGGVIPERDSLMVMTEQRFRGWFNVDIRANSEVLSIDREKKTVEVRGVDGNYRETYDKLLIATGSSPVNINLPGSDDPRVTRLWTIPDMDEIISKIKDGVKNVLVVGAGFIGLETAENLREIGLNVTLVEFLDQVLPTIDKEMATLLSNELTAQGISLKLGCKVERFEKDGSVLSAVLSDGSKVPADLVLMCVGVKPNSEIAKNAGLETGQRGHIIVDKFLRTSDPDVYAAGDVIEIPDPILGGSITVPLAGPANRQARIVADNMLGRSVKYPGSFGASIIKIGSLTAASVGLTERRLKQMGVKYRVIYAHPFSSATYYPGAERLHMKLVFSDDGKIFGAQVVGEKGVDKRIDAISATMRSGANVAELAELELSYAPPFNTAKDPVNMLGMLAEGALSGDTRIIQIGEIPENALLIDVREAAEFECDPTPGFVNIPLEKLRERLVEFDKSKPIVTSCAVGQRGYFAERILKQHGFDVYNLSGGSMTWKLFNPPAAGVAIDVDCKPDRPDISAKTDSDNMNPAKVIDVRAMACPGPVVNLKQSMDELAGGQALKLVAANSFEPDLRNWVASTGNKLVSLEKKADHLEAVVQKSSVNSVVAEEDGKHAVTSGHAASIILFSNDLDKAMGALRVACGMAAAGAKVGIFFTFWGLSVLRQNPAPAVKKNLISRMFGMMLPLGSTKLKLSKMNMGGMGSAMMKQVMAAKNVSSLPELLKQAKELGVKFIACDMAMDVMGITREELIEVDEVAGVASFVEMAKHSNNTLFI